MDASTIVFLCLLSLVVILPIGLYNGLVSRRNSVENAFASLDANLQKRFDLIPNVVAAVKGYAAHEQETLESLTQLRAQSNSPQSRLQNDGATAQLLSSVVAIAESYPDLKASANFEHLQRTLTEIEEQISASRRAFNATVSNYNTSIETFPGNLVASTFGFSRRDFFRAEENAKQAPTLSSGLTA